MLDVSRVVQGGGVGGAFLRVCYLNKYFVNYKMNPLTALYKKGKLFED